MPLGNVLKNVSNPLGGVTQKSKKLRKNKKEKTKQQTKPSVSKKQKTQPHTAPAPVPEELPKLSAEEQKQLTTYAEQLKQSPETAETALRNMTEEINKIPETELEQAAATATDEQYQKDLVNKIATDLYSKYLTQLGKYTKNEGLINAASSIGKWAFDPKALALVTGGEGKKLSGWNVAAGFGNFAKGLSEGIQTPYQNALKGAYLVSLLKGKTSTGTSGKDVRFTMNQARILAESFLNPIEKEYKGIDYTTLGFDFVKTILSGKTAKKYNDAIKAARQAYTQLHNKYLPELINTATSTGDITQVKEKANEILQSPEYQQYKKNINIALQALQEGIAKKQ